MFWPILFSTQVDRPVVAQQSEHEKLAQGNSGSHQVLGQSKATEEITQADQLGVFDRPVVVAQQSEELVEQTLMKGNSASHQAPLADVEPELLLHRIKGWKIQNKNHDDDFKNCYKNLQLAIKLAADLEA